MTWMLRQTLWIDRLANAVGRGGSLLILPLIFVIMFDVVTRKFEGAQQAIQNSWAYAFLSPTKLQEMEWHLHAAIFFLAFGMAYLANAHVRVDVLREGFSRRRQAWIEFLGLLVFAMPYLSVVIWFGWDFVSRSYVSGEGSAALTGLPNRWIIKSVLLIGLIMTFLVVLSVLVKLAAFLFGSDTSRRDADKLLSIIGADPAVAAQDDTADDDALIAAEHDFDRKGPST